MRDFKKTRGRRAQYLRMAGGMSLMLVLAAVAAGTGSAAWGMYSKFADAAAADAASQNELAALKLQYRNEAAAADGLGTSRGIDAAVRERWGYGLPGEREIDIIRPASTTASTTPQAQSVWGRLMATLFGWL